jgi:glycosyltransferase involved in cell wall biosynthesis
MPISVKVPEMKNPNIIDPKFIPAAYQQCTLSLMDNISDTHIRFDEKGICNYYYEYLELEKKYVFQGEQGLKKLQDAVSTIKKEGVGKKYDCITGVSGGVDSTYLAYLAKQQGLRPLIVHFDNGWNSELAVKNVENIILKLGFDLFTLVVNWEEFRDLQLAYLKSSVVDMEALTDHAIIGTLYQLAAGTADIVLAVNTPIAQSLCSYSRHVFIVPHGYHSSEPGSSLQAFNQWQTIYNSKRIKAVYVGNLDSFYLDIPLFVQLLQHHTEVNFFLMGPYKNTNELFKKFEKAPNVHFIGRLPFNQIQPFLDRADLLLMLYRADEFKDYLATSHKVLEYLASGKTIVSSFMADYVPHKELLLMAERNSEIPALFEKAINNLFIYNAEEMQQKRKAFAMNNTYAKQLDRITAYLQQMNLLP